MDSNPSKKCLQNQCIDRISELPDPILGHILSYLPVKSVIATSILSTRWKTLFPSSVPLIKLDIDDSYMLHNPPLNNSLSLHTEFVDFVDKLLNVTLCDVRCVKEVTVSCANEHGDNKIVSWVCAALRLNIQHLRLMSNLHNSLDLFDSLDGCTTLVELELELGYKFELNVPEEFLLPNLKRLTLRSFIFSEESDDTESIHELIVGCPVLHELSIVGFDLEGLDNLRIKHPILNKLFIKDCANEGRCGIVTNAPKLEVFAYEGCFGSSYVLKNVNSINSVCIVFYFSEEEDYLIGFRSTSQHLAWLVKACSSTTRLCLSEDSVMALHLSGVPLPKFQNLTWLALGRMGSDGWRVLAEFLKSAHNLTILTLEEELVFTRAYPRFKSLLRNVPACLELHLKKIEVWEFKCTRDEIKLMEYFLKNGKVLEELIVHCLSFVKKSTLKKLSMLPRHSKACQVLFREYTTRGKSRYSRENFF